MALGVALAGGPALALVPALGPAEIQQAIETGTRGIAESDFGAEWRVSLTGGGEITVTTPFARLAHAAHQAALRGETLTDEQRQQHLDRGRDRIQLLVELAGKSADFARWFRPVLRVGAREVAATFVQNERTGLRVEEGRFLARNIYVFPIADLPAQGSVTLVITNVPDGREVLRAPLDLGRLR